MGKTYLRYETRQSGGVLCSPLGQAADAFVLPPSHAGAKPQALVAVPGLESVLLWNLRTGALVAKATPHELPVGTAVEVTTLRVVRCEGSALGAAAAARFVLVVGYSNGFVAHFRLAAAAGTGAATASAPALAVTEDFFALGHKPGTMVLAIAVCADGTWLASGGQDTDVTVWDATAQEPLYRLRGHRGAVVAVAFVEPVAAAAATDGGNIGSVAHGSGAGNGVGGGSGVARRLATGSADGLVKIWDLGVQQCLQTIVACDTQVTAMLLDPSARRLLVGMRDTFVRVYGTERALETDPAAINAGALGVDVGVIGRKGAKAVTGMTFSPDYSVLLLVTAKAIEAFRVLSAEAVKKKVQRKRQRAAKAQRGGATATGTGGDAKDSDDDRDDNDADDADGGGARAASAAHEFAPLRTFHFEQRVRAACFAPIAGAGAKGSFQLVVTFADNSVRSYATALVEDASLGAATVTLSDLAPLAALEHGGHRGDVRGLAVAPDAATLLSLGADGVRVWGLPAGSDAGEDSGYGGGADAVDAGALTCVGSIAAANGDASCLALLPGGTSFVVGTEGGELLVCSTLAQAVVSRVAQAHGGAVKSVALRPGGGGVASCGLDRRVALWQLALDAATGAVSLELAREIEIAETPLFLRFSAGLGGGADATTGGLCAVALQNSSIQLFFADTMKPFLSLFGHKLPATAVAFSCDGTLCASVSIDKNLRFWGTDFGDCHRAIHAHDDYVTAVEFVPGTHHCFTASLDGSVKHWDGDNWTMIQAFRVHQHGVWALAVSAGGGCVATAGADRCIRLLLRTEEALFPEEEEEAAMQRAMDEEAARRQALNRIEAKDGEVGIAGQRSVASVNAAEALMDALDLVSVELQRRASGDPTVPQTVQLLLRGRSLWEYLWSSLEAIRPSELRHALSSLTSVHVEALLDGLAQAVEHRAVLNFEVAAKVLLALAKPPPGGNSANTLIPLGESADRLRQLQSLTAQVAAALGRDADAIGFNVAGLQFLRAQMEARRNVKFFDVSKVQGAKRKFSKRSAAQ